MRAVACMFAALLAGCASTDVLDANYGARLHTQVTIEQTQANVEIAKANADAARWAALARIAETGDQHTRQMAVLALALGDRSGVATQRVVQPLPGLPESDADRAYKWTALFAGPVTNIAAGWFGYRLGVTQSNNSASTTIAAYNAFGNMATTGYAALANTANTGYGAMTTIAGNIQAPQPNNIFSIGGNGTIGSGPYAAYDFTNVGNKNCVVGGGTSTSPTVPPSGGTLSNC